MIQRSKCPATRIILNDSTNKAQNCIPDFSITNSIKFPDKPSDLRRFNAAHRMFQQDFICDEFGNACFVCERIWYNSSLKPIPINAYSLLKNEFNLDENFDVCLLIINYLCDKNSALNQYHLNFRSKVTKYVILV